MIYTELLENYKTIYNQTTMPRMFFAPGRVNLIGEHTDYNGGHVFPVAISFGTYAFAQLRDDNKLRFHSMNFPDNGIIECDLADLTYDTKHSWANFPKGMIKYFIEAGFEIDCGMDVMIYGNIPNSSGLSSSASLEIVTGVMLECLFSLSIDRVKMIQIAQLVENEYIGVNCGIMDQFIIGKGKKDHAMLLNSETLQYHHAPIKLKSHTIVIINTNKQRALVDSKYNERRTQCDQALTALQAEISIDNLCQLTTSEFEQHKHLITNQTDQKRAKHVVYENERTLKALKELQQNNLPAFGKLMNESHVSLQQDYEVTGIELDTIAHNAWEQPGVIGARMTGAGFGGCAIAIVEKTEVDNFKENIKRIYLEKVGYQPTFYIADIGDGAKEITEGVL